MTEWEPATEAEVAMRDALHANDQELYFRVLARTDLLLPVSTPAVAGQPAPGWGTWTTGGRTHVLAFTSAAALRACLGDHAGTNRRVPFTDLAAGWPNHEWWLAVNPGLSVEGYLPAWFVSQLSRGDVRLPGRTMGARARLERAETLARSRAGGTGRDSGTPSTPVPSDPAATLPGRRSLRGAVPSALDGGTVPGPEATSPSTSARSEPPRRPGGDDMPAAGRRQSTEAAPSVQNTAPVAPSRFGAATPVDRSGAGFAPASGNRPADGSANPSAGNGGDVGGRRSFFEPASGPSPSRFGERAAPPSRFGLGSQPFPRRRPADAPAGGTPPRPFPTQTGDPDATRPLRPSTVPPSPSGAVRAPAPGTETTQPLPPRRPDPLAEEPTRAFRVPGPAAAGPARAGRSDADEERTQPILRDRPATSGRYEPEPVDDLPASIAEPVSGPPAPRRGFTPIVIEGTIVESRDLVDPHPSPGPAPWSTAATAASSPTVDTDRPSGPAPSGSGFGEDPGRRSAGPADRDRPASSPTNGVPPGGPGPRVPAGDDIDANDAIPTDAGPSGAGQREAGPSGAGTGEAGRNGTDEGGRPAEADVPAAGPAPTDFQPANTVEEDLLGAAGSGSTDTFLSTLLLARVLLPAAPESVRGSRPGEPGFVWRTAQLDGETYVVVYTSPERLADHVDSEVDTVRVKFAQLIRRWPDEDWSFAVNPGTPVGAKLPGEQIVALANWAAEVGLGDDLETEPEEPPAAAEPTARPRYAPAAVDPARPTVMQKAVAPSQLAYYLDRGYDRVSGFVHRAGELAHLTTPAQLHEALGLSYPDSPFSRDAEEIYVLRWPAHRPSLYRIPYGGQNEAAMRAMEGWVIERPPFRGNGFAPGESSDVVAEFKVDSARLPHGAQLWRIGGDGSERVVAVLDTDALVWRRTGEA
ncbi:SseB family protein [Micromonospora sp. GCM10011542]|uniref:SseB family protein n=1 Tax=Micromonospora sp. GCM10011542 TaxID=3317337 RepID=UPI003609476D